MRFFIKLFSFPPIAGAEDANFLPSANKSDRGNAPVCFTDAKKALFIDTVCHIFKDKALGVGKGILGVIKRDAMFFNVDSVFGFAPLKFHGLSVIQVCKVVNIIIWKTSLYLRDTPIFSV